MVKQCKVWASFVVSKQRNLLVTLVASFSSFEVWTPSFFLISARKFSPCCHVVLTFYSFHVATGTGHQSCWEVQGVWKKSSRWITYMDSLCHVLAGNFWVSLSKQQFWGQSFSATTIYDQSTNPLDKREGFQEALFGEGVAWRVMIIEHIPLKRYRKVIFSTTSGKVPCFNSDEWWCLVKRLRFREAKMHIFFFLDVLRDVE